MHAHYVESAKHCLVQTRLLLERVWLSVPHEVLTVNPCEITVHRYQMHQKGRLPT